MVVLRGPMVGMSEGEKLRRLMERHAKTQAELGRLLNIGRAAVNHYFEKERFSAKVWIKLKVALPKMGMDPADVRPREDDEVQHDEDLTVLVEDWSHEHLEQLRTILMASAPSRTHVLAYVNGALRQRR